MLLLRSNSRKSPSKRKTYCQYCVDNDGQLKEREIIKNVIAGWLSHWSPENLSQDEALCRAELYLQSIPQWVSQTLN